MTRGGPQRERPAGARTLQAVASLGSMGPTAVRRLLLRHCTKGAMAVVAVVLFSAAVAMHHTDLSPADSPHHTGMGEVAEMCLAAFTAVGAAVVAVTVGLVVLGRWRPPLILGPTSVPVAARVPAARARAGPPLLLLLCVSRR